MPLIRVQFDCPKCGKPFDDVLSVAFPDFTAERTKDMGVLETHEAACDNCGSDFEIETFSEMGGITATLDGNDLYFEEIYEPEPPDEDYVPPHDVFAEFEASQAELDTVLWALTDPFDDKPTPPSDALIRMVFSQHVAVLEAYLADRVHREAIDNPAAKLRLVRGANVFQGKSVSLHDALGDPGAAERQFAETIKSVLYHRFADMENLYRIAFRSSTVFPSPENRAELEDAVKLRHHCVHRNGKDMEGTAQTITTDDVARVAAATLGLVDNIERIIEACRSKDAPPTPELSPDAAAPE